MTTHKQPAGPPSRLRRSMAERAIAEGRDHYALTIGELFPDGDAAAQWVFSVTALVEDIGVLMKALRRAGEEEDLRASLFFYRQLVTRLFEARRLATTARTVPEIANFVGDLLRRPPGSIDLEQVYRRDPETMSSRVERLYAKLRHRSVHYLEPSGDELSDVLWRHSGYPAQIELGNGDREQRTLWFQWVHAVTAADVYGDVHDPEFLKSMNERNKLVAEIAMSWTLVAGIAVVLHVRRLGIDSRGLVMSPSRRPGIPHSLFEPARQDDAGSIPTAIGPTFMRVATGPQLLRARP
jgi:hypothetical protein